MWRRRLRSSGHTPGPHRTAPVSAAASGGDRRRRRYDRIVVIIATTAITVIGKYAVDESAAAAMYTTRTRIHARPSSNRVHRTHIYTTHTHTHKTHGRTHKCIMVVNNREKKPLATENALLFQTGFDLIQFKHFVDLI